MGVRSTKFLVLAGALGITSAAGCSSDDPPLDPTWADVQPILRAECSDCHGASALASGGGYRFDFYDMTPNPCGDAAMVLADASLALAQRDNIAKAITSTDEYVRPAMPPIPAPYLTDNEWLTILRWTANPAKGDKPSGNRSPHIVADGTPTSADKTLDVHVVVTDPDGDPVVGVVKNGDDVIARMDHAGAFSATFDTSSWPTGATTLRAVLCDGWSQVSLNLLEIQIQH